VVATCGKPTAAGVDHGGSPATHGGT